MMLPKTVSGLLAFGELNSWDRQSHDKQSSGRE